jgi:hypothetical protein
MARKVPDQKRGPQTAAGRVTVWSAVPTMRGVMVARRRRRLSCQAAAWKVQQRLRRTDDQQRVD